MRQLSLIRAQFFDRCRRRLPPRAGKGIVGKAVNRQAGAISFNHKGADYPCNAGRQLLAQNRLGDGLEHGEGAATGACRETSPSGGPSPGPAQRQRRRRVAKVLPGDPVARSNCSLASQAKFGLSFRALSPAKLDFQCSSDWRMLLVVDRTVATVTAFRRGPATAGMNWWTGFVPLSKIGLILSSQLQRSYGAVSAGG